jgi:hypothetical protein
MKNIQIGDTVEVIWSGRYANHVYKAKVLYLPCSSGDMMHVEREDGYIEWINPTCGNFSGLLKKSEDE